MIVVVLLSLSRLMTEREVGGVGVIVVVLLSLSRLMTEREVGGRGCSDCCSIVESV